MKSDDIKILFAGFALLMVLAGKSGGLNNPATDLPKRVAVPAEVVPEKSLALAQTNAVVAQKVEAPEQFPVRADWTLLDPSLSVKAAVAKDLDSNVDMYRFNTGERWALASLTKLMTAVIAIENVGLDKVATVSEKTMAVDGTAGNLQLGEQYAVGELLKAMLAVSSNRAAAAIADAYGASQFVDQMQMKASSLGMTQTTYVEPTGLSFLNQGTVGDLERLVAYIYRNHPEIFDITRQKTVTIHEETKNSGSALLNINAFAQTRDDFFGGKTGFTDLAGGNLITIFNHEGRKLLFIVLGTDDRFGQTDLLYTWVKRAFAFK